MEKGCEVIQEVQERELIELFRNLSDEQKALVFLSVEVASIMEGARP